MSNPITVEREREIIIVRFTRPEIRNPLSADVLTEMERILSEVSGDPSLRKLIFTGTDNIFASGADLREIGALSAADAPAFARRGQKIMNRISALKTETVAAINGYCFGGALDLALACSRRVGAPTAKFCHPGTGLGIITGWGGTQRLPRLIGEANAMEMFLTASPITAEEALRIGLIDQITEVPLTAVSS